MHAADINCIVAELEGIVGSRVDKVYQDGPRVVRIRFYGGPVGRAELLIETGRRIHLTNYRRRAPKNPTSFAMYLRKHIGNKVLSGVSQHDFDRIVTLEFDGLRLVAEIFARGNLVLLDPDSRVMLSMKKGVGDRVIRGEAYTFPCPLLSPFDVQDTARLRESLRRQDLVRSLAVDLGLGRLYANELCEATGLPKDADPTKLPEEDARKVIEWLKGFRQAISPANQPVYYGRDDPVEFSPFVLASMKGVEHITADSFNQAADVCYAEEEKEGFVAQSTASRDEKRSKLEKRLEIQKSQLQHLQERSEEMRRWGDAIYSHFTDVSAILDRLVQQTKLDPKDIPEEIGRLGVAAKFVGYSPRDKTLLLRLSETEVPINVSRTAGENAGNLYEKAKELESRSEGARSAVARTEAELRRLAFVDDSSTAPGPRPREIRKRDWYEKFRWFISSDGNLVLSGRDARSNEVLVRTHLEGQDLYVHADVHGGPSTVVKAGKEVISAQTIREALVQSIIHSSIWKAGTTAGDAYWVNADQVTKRPTSGEYVARGAFVIRGKRNYETGISARCGVGWMRDRFMCGPLDAVSSQCQRTLELVPGDLKKSEVAKEIIARLAPDRSPADLDQLIQVLPAGRLKIVD